MSGPHSNDQPLIINRRVLLTAFTGAGLVLALPAAIVLSHDDDDHEEDNSGRGSSSGHGDDDHDDDRSDDDLDDTGEVAPLGTVPPGSIEVRIVDDDANGFQPGTVSVEPGQTVTFVNLDDDAHTATGAEFDTGIFQPGEQVTVTVDEAGTYPFACQIHPVMTGIIEVGDGVAAIAGSPEASPAASPGAGTPVAASGETAVSIRDLNFDPAEISISTGTAVTWTNDDSVPHTASADDQSFDTGPMNPGDAEAITFDQPGEFPYFCAFHPDMNGLVIVT